MIVGVKDIVFLSPVSASATNETVGKSLTGSMLIPDCGHSEKYPHFASPAEGSVGDRPQGRWFVIQ